MPELPEVEVSARIAASALKNSQIEAIVIKDCKLFRPPNLTTINTDVPTQSGTIKQDFYWQSGDLLALFNHARPLAPYTLRLGKLMASLFEAKDGRVFCLFARLGMTGKFVQTSHETLPHKSMKLSLSLAKNLTETVTKGSPKLRLDFLNTRMFGQLWVQSSQQAVAQQQQLDTAKAIFKSEVLRSKMGVDAYELSAQPEEWLKHIREYAQHRKVKTALLDQSLFAGIGNIYAAECLFVAHAHPLAKFSQLSDEQLLLMANGLHESMTQTLVRSEGQGEVIYGSGLGPDSPFRVYGREDQACYNCDQPLSFLRISGRATVFCQHCQKLDE
mgnify:CR=1 FL=1